MRRKSSERKYQFFYIFKVALEEIGRRLQVAPESSHHSSIQPDQTLRFSRDFDLQSRQVARV